MNKRFNRRRLAAGLCLLGSSTAIFGATAPHHHASAPFFTGLAAGVVVAVAIVALMSRLGLSSCSPFCGSSLLGRRFRR